jgi:hypothetical protein
LELIFPARIVFGRRLKRTSGYGFAHAFPAEVTIVGPSGRAIASRLSPPHRREKHDSIPLRPPMLTLLYNARISLCLGPALKAHSNIPAALISGMRSTLPHRGQTGSTACRKFFRLPAFPMTKPGHGSTRHLQSTDPLQPFARQALEIRECRSFALADAWQRYAIGLEERITRGARAPPGRG